MQNRYLGDIHDFLKLNFLLFLSRYSKKKVGLNWYLVDPNYLGENELALNDGEKRNYLKNEKFISENKKLLSEFKDLIPKKNRVISSYTKNTFLKKKYKVF